MFHGRFQLGQDVLLYLQCRDGSNKPVDPDAVPQVAIYDASGHAVANGEMPILDHAATVGFFTARLFLTSVFEVGQYTAAYRWLVSGTTYQDLAHFEVMPGGSASGQIIAMASYERAPGRYIINQRTSGFIYRGRNPIA